MDQELKKRLIRVLLIAIGLQLVVVGLVVGWRLTMRDTIGIGTEVSATIRLGDSSRQGEVTITVDRILRPESGPAKVDAKVYAARFKEAQIKEGSPGFVMVVRPEGVEFEYRVRIDAITNESVTFTLSKVPR